jgi:hypothetical protein
MGVLVGVLAFMATPALAAPPETPITEAATAVTGTTATLHGTLNPNASATAGYYFAYGRNGFCEENFTEAAAEATGEAIKVSTTLTKLEGSTKYTFCVFAYHTEEGVTEVASGSPLTFTTGFAKPVVEPGEAFASPFSASIFAFVNPENQSTSCTFEYGETTSYGHSLPCEQGTLQGGERQFVSTNFGELTPGTTYHYRVVATNGSGETQGTDGEFTTPPLEAPIFEGETASKVTASSAELEANVNPNYQSTSYLFEYSTDETLATKVKTVPGANQLPPEFGGRPADVAIAGLSPLTNYYFRVVATNPSGTTIGPIEHFFTNGTPIVTTEAAQQVTQTTAEVSGTVNPSGAPTSAHIAFITQQGYEAAGGSTVTDPYAAGRSSAETGSLGSDFSPHSIGLVQLRELTPGTTYHYAVVATSSEGTTIGPDMTFTTAPPTPPSTTTGGAVNVNQTSATILGEAKTNGLPTTVAFEFGSTPALGSLQPATIESESGATLTFSASFGPQPGAAGYLQPGTTYYYRVRGSNADGVSYGAVRTFTTTTFPGPPSVVAPSPLAQPPATAPAPTPTTTSKPRSKALTNAQKLRKALKACAKKPKSKRAACRAHARKKYKKKRK